MDRIEELAAVTMRHAPPEGMAGTAIRGLSLIRADRPTVPVPSVYEASLCMIAQGSKRVSLAGESVLYDAAHYLLVSVDLPLVGHVIEASPSEPYLCCKVDIDQAALADLIVAEGAPPRRAELPALAVYPSDPDLVDAVCRLVKLLERPASIAALAPLIEREILYRLLTGPHGSGLAQMATVDSRLNQVSRAIAKIRAHFNERLRVDDIAAAAGMSTSSLHEHFKAITRTSPLDYQKQLRLQEARRLMLSNGIGAGAAGYAVGYDSQSQFSREYNRLFGAPPRRDIERLQTMGDYMPAV